MISYLHGNSPVFRPVSMGRIIVVLFWKKYAIPCQLKPGILNLTIGRSQSNFRVVFIFVSPEKKADSLVLTVARTRGTAAICSVRELLRENMYSTSASWKKRRAEGEGRGVEIGLWILPKMFGEGVCGLLRKMWFRARNPFIKTWPTYWHPIFSLLKLLRVSFRS